MSESEIAAATELVIDCAALCRLLRGESDSCRFNSEASETFMAVAMQHLMAGGEPSSSSLALLPAINEHFPTAMRTSMQVNRLLSIEFAFPPSPDLLFPKRYSFCCGAEFRESVPAPVHSFCPAILFGTRVINVCATIVFAVRVGPRLRRLRS